MPRQACLGANSISRRCSAGSSPRAWNCIVRSGADGRSGRRDSDGSPTSARRKDANDAMTTTTNSWVLITGASSGFGEEFSRQYAQQGRSLVLVARRLDRLQALAEALRRQYRIDVVVERADLSDVASVIHLQRSLRDQGIAIDILINNAGHGLQGPFVDSQLHAALAMVQLDVVSLTAVTHVFAQDMRARGRGKILLVASLLAYQGVQNFAVYSAAKAY